MSLPPSLPPHQVDFEELVARSQAIQRRQEEREERRAALLRQRAREAREEMKERQADVNSCLKQMESCFEILIPRFDIPETSGPSLQLQSAGDGSKQLSRLQSTSSGSFYSIEFSGDEGEEEEEEKEVEKENEVDREKGERSEGVQLTVGTEPRNHGDKTGVLPVQDDSTCPAQDEESVRVKGDGEGVEGEGALSSDESECEWEEVEAMGGEEEAIQLLQAHGIPSHSYSLSIELPVQVTMPPVTTPLHPLPSLSFPFPSLRWWRTRTTAVS